MVVVRLFPFWILTWFMECAGMTGSGRKQSCPGTIVFWRAVSGIRQNCLVLGGFWKMRPVWNGIKNRNTHPRLWQHASITSAIRTLMFHFFWSDNIVAMAFQYLLEVRKHFPLFQSRSTYEGIPSKERKGKKRLFLFTTQELKTAVQIPDFQQVQIWNNCSQKPKNNYSRHSVPILHG